MQLTPERWQAIKNNDSTYDERFIYAVTSTGICCRPSCHSKVPKKENIRIYKNVEEAMEAGFRPCKRCKPGGIRLPNEEWISQIKEYIEQNYQEALTLNHLADMCHGSPYHLQRIFKKNTGVSPAEYVQHVRILNAKRELEFFDKSVAEIGFAVGLSNTPYFITLFKNKTGKTPKQYQKERREEE